MGTGRTLQGTVGAQERVGMQPAVGGQGRGETELSEPGEVLWAELWPRGCLLKSQPHTSACACIWRAGLGRVTKVQ